MTIQWLTGDALVAELRRIRLKDSAAEFKNGLARLDQMLDASGVAQIQARAIAQSIRNVVSPKLQPMVLSKRDFAISMRILRALQFEDDACLFVTSADSIGHGYGILVKIDGDVQYVDRVTRQTYKNCVTSLNPSMITESDEPTLQCAATVESGKNGFQINLMGLPEGKRLKADFMSSLAYRGADGKLKIDSFHSLDLTLSRTAQGIAIYPKSAEATIRLASIATTGVVIRISGSFEVVARLELSGNGIQPVEAFFCRARSNLKQWLDCPALPYALQVKTETPDHRVKA
jgi:hypothetical protein